MDISDDLDKHFKHLDRLIFGAKVDKGEFIRENCKPFWWIQHINGTGSECQRHVLTTEHLE